MTATTQPALDIGIPTSAHAQPHLHSWEEVSSALEVTPATGLTAAQADLRLTRMGRNALTEQPPRPWWKVFGDQLRNALFGILLAAAALAAVVGDVTDAAIIAVVLLLNSTIGFAQERRATRSLAALKQMLVAVATVRRDGSLSSVDATDLVPGDVVVLQAGSRVPADGRLVVAHEVQVDQSSLTGESEPVDKVAARLASDVALADRLNMLHAGSLVVRGRAEMVITATGMNTEVGKIAGILTSTSPPQTPLQRQLDVAGRRIAFIGIAAVSLYSLAAVLQGEPLADIILRGVALAVAAVPEGLPAVLALVLAVGVHRMAQHGAIVRHLASVETLGSATVICSDKTGTLTRNRMTVRRLATPAEVLAEPHLPHDRARDHTRLLRALVLCNDAAVTGATMVGDPMSVALLAAATDEGITPEAVRASAPRVGELPFSADRKYMATAHHHLDGTTLLAVKGAPDMLLPRCGRVELTEGDIPLDDAQRSLLLDAVTQMGSAGLRVLAAADRTLSTAPATGWSADTVQTACEDLVLVGFAALADPPRPEAVDAVAQCRRAGIAVKMITGDHVATAAAIGAELGIPGRAVTGQQIDAMTADELAEAVDGIGVFARVNPAHKVAIVSALTARGHVAAMTGDGQNDAAAVRAAHVGVAMGRTGTDVTKEAADLVLTDDNFATIVRAVRQGRGIYDNIVKFMRFQLTTNIAAILTFVTTAFVGLPAPMTAVQVLWVNLIADGPPALALGMDQPDKHTMDRPPRPAGERILSWPRLWRMALTAAVMAAGTLAVLASTDHARGATYASTFAFTTFVLFQVVSAFNVRSEHESAFSATLPANPWLFVSLGVVVGLQALVVYVPALQDVFGTVALDPVHWAVGLGVALTALVVGELDKAIRRRRARGALAPPHRDSAPQGAHGGPTASVPRRV